MRAQFLKVLVPSLFLALAGLASDAGAADPFGPVESRTFHFKSGATIELPPSTGCRMNQDVLLITGPNVNSSTVKSGDITPNTKSHGPGSFLPSTTCSSPNCVQLYVWTTDKDKPGTRTVTLKHSDGRTVQTTFDVVANTSGRCDIK